MSPLWKIRRPDLEIRKVNLHYITRCYSGSLAQCKCLIESILKFDTESPITVIVDHDSVMQSARWFDDHGCQVHTPLGVGRLCRDIDLPWGLKFANRSGRDKAWAMQSCLPAWAMALYPDDPLFVYVDPDCFFFQDLRPYVEQLPSSCEVAVCPHFFPTGFENNSAGRFNNGILNWKNTPTVREHMHRWGRETMERWQPGHPREIPHEQLLLNDWPAILGNKLAEFPPAVCWGPWRRDKVAAGEIQSLHAHELWRGTGRNPITINGESWNRTNYPLSPETIETLYQPYEKALAAFL